MIEARNLAGQKKRYGYPLISCHSINFPETQDGRLKRPVICTFLWPVFPEVIHTATFPVADSTQYGFEENRIPAKITIDIKNQVVTRRAYSLCKPIKTPKLLDILCGTFSLSTGYPQALWRAFLPIKTKKKPLISQGLFYVSGWRRSAKNNFIVYLPVHTVRVQIAG